MSDQGYPVQQYTNLDNDIVLEVLSDGTVVLITGVTISSGSGDPTGIVVAPVGSLYIDKDGTDPDIWFQNQTGDEFGWVPVNVSGGGGGAVSSVFGRVGVVVADKNDYSAVTDLQLGDGAGQLISINSGGSFIQMVAGGGQNFTMSPAAMTLNSLNKIQITAAIIEMPDGFIDASAAGLNVKGGPAFSTLVVTDGSVSLTDAHFNGMTTNGVTDTVQVSDAGGDTLLFAGGKIQSTVLIEAPSVKANNNEGIGGNSTPGQINGVVFGQTYPGSGGGVSAVDVAPNAFASGTFNIGLSVGAVTESAADFMYAIGSEAMTELTDANNHTAMYATFSGADHFGSGTVGTLAGINAAAFNDGAGHVTTLIGAFVGTGNFGSGVVATSIGVSVQSGGSTGTITNDYSIRMLAPISGATFTNPHVGLQIEDQTVGGAHPTFLAINVVGGVVKLGPNRLNKTGLLVFANNAAAITGGLVAGDFYRTGADPDVVCVVH